MRVFLGLTEVAGYYSALESGLNSIGIETMFVTLCGHPFRYQCSQEPALGRIARRTTQLRFRFRRRFLAVRILFGTLDVAARAVLLAWALLRCDVFVFGFATTLFRYLEFPLIRRLGKKLICIFHGSDERPPYLNGYVVDRGSAPSLAEMVQMAAEQKKRIRRIEKYAHAIISHPPSAQFHEKPFVPYHVLGVPSLAGEMAPAPDHHDRNGVIRILHAPSRPGPKGTDVIRTAIAKLQSSGYPIEYVELSGRTHEQVLRELARCDFIIDELWSDTPMAHVATEAAWAGKPTLVGGYAWPWLEQTVPQDGIPPSYRCHPDELEPAILKLIEQPSFRRELGTKARCFVEKNWSPHRVAERLLMIARDQTPDEWLFNPQEVTYFYGSGIRSDCLRELTGRIVRQFGVGALHIMDKPELQKDLLAFASTHEGVEGGSHAEAVTC